MKHRTAPRSPAILGKGAPHADKRTVEEFVRFRYEIMDSIAEYEARKRGLENTSKVPSSEPIMESQDITS